MISSIIKQSGGQSTHWMMMLPRNDDPQADLGSGTFGQ
jgi:hypothetical protein